MAAVVCLPVSAVPSLTDQVSLFAAAGIGQHVGGFAQFTYDGVARQFHWDNLDVRLVNHGQVPGQEATYGLSLNNNPTVQDPWNTTAAWGYPYTASALAGGTAHVGAFGLWAKINPGRDHTSGQTDHFVDIGLDASWQKTVASGDIVAANLRLGVQ